MIRRLWLTASVLAVFGVLGAPALAARPGGLPTVASTTHFQAHYLSDPDDAAYTTQPKVLNMLALAERAYTAYQGWGFATPLDDGDGKVDVYVADLSALGGVLAYADTDVNAATSPGYMVVDAKTVDREDLGLTMAHELMHVVQFASWADPATSDNWLFEGEAEWAAAKLYGFPASEVAATGPSDLSLDCRDAVNGYMKCDSDGYIDGGYSRWPFFQALAGRFGANFVQGVFRQGAAGMTATDALIAAIGAKGGTLGDVFGDWSVQQMAGTYGIVSLDAKAPATYAGVSTGAKTAALPSFQVAVDHLATRYVKILRGDGAADHPCFAATLTVTVTIPAGVTSRPFLYWNQTGSAPVALSVSGTTASATVPWDTCFWSANWAYLSLPNATTTVDGADFSVAMSVTVDEKTPAAATAAPKQDPVYGGVTDVPTADPAPAISLFGPLLLQVSSKSPTLRLIVHSTGDGLLRATLGSLSLGTPELRAGNNDLRFKVPKALLSTLRRSAAAKNLLTLTPLSPSGATGAAVTRQVRLKK